jgi:hypothetical protein
MFVRVCVRACVRVFVCTSTPAPYPGAFGVERVISAARLAPMRVGRRDVFQPLGGAQGDGGRRRHLPVPQKSPKMSPTEAKEPYTRALLTAKELFQSA